MGDVRLGLPSLDMEDVTLAVRDNDKVILVDLDIEEEGGESVADDVETGADPDTEDMESIIRELSVVSSSMSISITISLLIIPSPSAGRGSLDALDRAVKLGNCRFRCGGGLRWCDSFFTPVIILVYIGDKFVVVGDMILVRIGH